MNDLFSYSRGKILLKVPDFYSRIFTGARSKTAEHNVYERSGSASVKENKKAQNLKKTNDN